MKFIGYALILFSIINLLINMPAFFAIRRLGKSIEIADNPDAHKQYQELEAPQVEYHGGLIIFSIGMLLAGIYIAINGSTIWQLVGFVFLLWGLSSLVQSFRKIETQVTMIQFGDLQTQLSTVQRRLRWFAVIKFAIGLYLIG